MYSLESKNKKNNEIIFFDLSEYHFPHHRAFNIEAYIFCDVKSL